MYFFFFNDTATTEIYTLSLHDALPIAVVGESGSGKSTLAACLACLESPTAGNILVQGREASKPLERPRQQDPLQRLAGLSEQPTISYPPVGVMEGLAQLSRLQRTICL